MALKADRALGRLARLRQGSYRLLSATLLYPEESTLEVASEAASFLRRRRQSVAGLAFYGAWDRFLQTVGAFSPAETPALQRTYDDVFVGASDSKAVPLTETGYLGSGAMDASGRILADVQREYASVGFSLAPFDHQMPDHATVELGFVSLLSGLEAGAWEAEDSHSALEAIGHQARFLERHPRWWFPSLARSLALRRGGGLYAIAAQAAWAMAAHDADFLGAVIHQMTGKAADRQGHARVAAH